MTITLSIYDVMYFLLGIFVGYMLPRARRYYGSYRRRYRSRRRY